MSKRNESDDSTEFSATGASKKLRLDLEQWITPAKTLAVELHNVFKDGTDSKTSATGQIATKKLMRIFASMQNYTVENVVLRTSHQFPI